MVDPGSSAKPAGRGSLTVTSAAGDGPRLVTRTWYVTVPPSTTVAGPVLVASTSAVAVPGVAHSGRTVGSSTAVRTTLTTSPVCTSKICPAGAVDCTRIGSLAESPTNSPCTLVVALKR